MCGPPIMMKFVSRKLLERGYAPENIYLSMEKNMSCGVGKCGHCRLGPYYVCKDGPVFRYAELAPLHRMWEQVAHGKPTRHRPGRSASSARSAPSTARTYYRALPADHGIRTLRERATFLVVCRRCEEPSCVAACRFEALERQADGVLERHNLRCVSCKCCTHACPFGTIYPDMLPFYETACDYCLRPVGAAEPPCVASCRRGGARVPGGRDPDEDGVHIVDEQPGGARPKWEKREPPRGRGAG